MKKTLFTVLTIWVLFLPIIVIFVVYLTMRINIFDNPDFWYGYMAYFGTVALAAVALWQNEVFKNENDNSQNRLETIYQQANEINTINKILEFEHLRIHNLYGYLDEFEKACDRYNIVIALYGCSNERIVIKQLNEKCDFLFLSVTRELRADRRSCKTRDDLIDKCRELYNAAVELLVAYDEKKSESIISQKDEKLHQVWKDFFTLKEKYINSAQRDFQKLLYGNLTLQEIRSIYYNIDTEETLNGQT